jgi:hypothetical protein
MKKLISAAVVFAVVGSALAFKPATQANIYCYIENQQPSTCQAADKVNFIESTNSQDPSTPCVSGKVAYLNVSSVCTKSGASHFQEVDE